MQIYFKTIRVSKGLKNFQQRIQHSHKHFAGQRSVDNQKNAQIVKLELVFCGCIVFHFLKTFGRELKGSLQNFIHINRESLSIF